MPEMATNYHGGGSQSPNSLSKPIERVFEDAQHTGEIHLSGRKLREYPKLASKYDLVDTISADISKNRMPEVPKEICAYISMEKLNCYHNVIKSIPEALVQLQALTYLNLSRNQLSIIPSFISQLQALEVLIACHNRLVSLPEEIGVLDKLMELDVSCNEISHLPLQIGDLKSLKSLNVRRNLLQELPVEISKLNLRKLDISSNRISKIPTVFRRIETLEEIILDNNPLTTPPAHVCTKGKQHIMKYLHIIAIREDKARLGMLGGVDIKGFRKSLPPTQSVSSEEFRNLVESPDKWKRHTVLSSDSGYSTTDSVDKCGWSPQEGGLEAPHLMESNNLAMRAAAAVCRDQRIYPPPREPRRDPPEPPQRLSSQLSAEKLNKPTTPQTLTPGSTRSTISTPPTPPTLYPSNPPTPLTPPTPQGPGPGIAVGDGPAILGTSLEDEFTRELQRQKQDYENRKKIAEQLRIQQEEEDREQRRLAQQRILEEQQAIVQREAEEARRREEDKRLAEEARKAAEIEAKKVEAARQAQEAHRREEMLRQDETRHNKNDNNFYVKSNNSYNYNNNFNAWPPPPSPLANQNEAWNSPVSNDNKALNSSSNNNDTNSPVSPDQHAGHRTSSNHYSYTQHGYSNQIKSPTSPGYLGPGQNYRAPSQQSPAFASPHVFSPGYSSNQSQHTGYSISNSASPQDSPAYRQGSSQHGQSSHDHPGFRPGSNQSGHAGYQSPSSNPHSPVYPGQWNEPQRQSPASGMQAVSSGHSTSYHGQHNSETLRQSPDIPYGRSQSYQPASADQYGQKVQQNVMYSRSHSAQHTSDSSVYQNVYNPSLSNEITSPNTSVLHGSYRDSSNTRQPMSPLHEQTEPSHHGYYGNIEHGRYGNQHVSPNSMSHDSHSDFRKTTVGASNSFKEERRAGEGLQPYRRTVSDSNQRLPASSHPSHVTHTNGPIDEQSSMNGTTPTPTNLSVDNSPNTSFNSASSTPPHGGPTPPHGVSITNGPSLERPNTPQGSVGNRKSKPTERGQISNPKVSKPGEKPSRTPGTSSSKSSLPTSRKSSLNQDEEIRRSNPNLKDGVKPCGDQRVRSIQKDAVNNLINRRSSGSTSSEDDRKRATPTRSLAMQHSAASVSKRSGTGMSGTTRTTTTRTTTSASRTSPASRAQPPTSQTTRSRMRNNSTSSNASVTSTSSKSNVDKSKRSGTVMTSAHVKMLDDYSKEANGSNMTMQRQRDQHNESRQQLEQLRKTISTRLKRSLPENLAEALSDGVLLCHLANQIKPRSVASVHVPSPAVPKLTPPKCRKNVENFLEACKKIGVSKDHICDATDILSERGVQRVATTVAALVSVGSHSKHQVASNV